jgi:tetratricopeptide (TPR) repeat protein
MAVLKFSRGTVVAFKAMEQYTRRYNRMAREEIRKTLTKRATSAHDLAVAARIYIEDWRNGWFDGFEEGMSSLGHAKRFAKQARDRNPQVWYVQWKYAYATNFRARWKGWGEMGLADEAYRRSLNLLEEQYGLPEGGNAVDRGHYLDVLVDRAESWVYQDRAGAAAAEIARAMALYNEEKDPARKPKLDPWYYWAYGFALHQQDRYIEACNALEPLLTAKDANNDIRLLLALNYARRAENGEAGMKQKAADMIAMFHKERDSMAAGHSEDEEPRWTVQLELGCGAFLRGSPGEAHWLESLRQLLEEGEPPADPAQAKKASVTEASKPSAATPRRAVGKPARKQAAKKAATPKAPAKKPAARKAAAKKSAAKKPAAKKPARRPAGKKTTGKKATSKKTAAKKAVRKSRRR